ncbi:MAG: hypothetical protein HY301_04125 [Verrucomicrobia bacterium]|nr:hypothetical protein [Verrucomicrobiota bacterium]
MLRPQGYNPLTELLRAVLFLAVLLPGVGVFAGGDFAITSFSPGGVIRWADGLTNGICTLSHAASPGGPWVPELNAFTTGATGAIAATLPITNHAYFRLLLRDVPANDGGFTNLTLAYGILETLAGRGLVGTDGVNNWTNTFEGGRATNAELSRPHNAMGDDAGNYYIVDKDSQSVLKVTPDGNIHTAAGSHTLGNNGDGPAPATNLHMSSPNGLWVRGDGTFYILDKDNGKIRKVDTNGVMTTMFTVSGGNISQGRGLWVSADESLVYFCAGTRVRKWTLTGGVTNVATGFLELGNLAVASDGSLYVTDRVGNLVYLVADDGSADKTIIAGTGGTSGGGDGSAALDTAFYGVRGIWFLPTGGYLLATHEGSKVWYVDAADTVHLFVDGVHNAHTGDGAWFHSAGQKISEPRAVTMDSRGNILITDNDTGYLRRIRFLPVAP